jgi:nuclear pore complex protein Nup205
MPSLQLVNALLATLGAKHATASNQALDFLSRHSATIVILVKNEIDDLSLALLEEVHLIVSLCAQVLPLVSQNELVGPKSDCRNFSHLHLTQMSTHSGFGAINSAILSLSTGCFAGGPWVEQIRPQTDTEITDANTPATGERILI